METFDIYIIVTLIVLAGMCIAVVAERRRNRRLLGEKSDYSLMLSNADNGYANAVEDNRRLRKLKHDMLEQLALVDGMSETDSSPLSILVGRKQQEADDRGIDFDCYEDFVDTLDRWVSICGVNEVDMTALITNLINNAFEACCCCEKKLVRLMCRETSDEVQIYVSNSKTEYRHPLEEGFVTTKSDRESHGYGTQIIRDIVAKYKGDMTIEDKGDMFDIVISFLHI